MNDLILFVFWGALGGIANCLLLEGGFPRPRMITRDGLKKLWDPGFLGNLFLGAIASVIIFGLGDFHNLHLGRKLAIGLLSGIGGGTLITNLVQRFETTQYQKITNEVINALKAVEKEKSKNEE